jgi:oxygen-independent coproporphyrinogen-3 oxidase
LEAGQLPVYRALTPTTKERFIREFILQLKLGRVSRGYFVGKFGMDPVEQCKDGVRRLVDWGYLTVDADELRLNRDGLLQVDRLLQEFFLPEHRSARYS